MEMAIERIRKTKQPQKKSMKYIIILIVGIGILLSIKAHSQEVSKVHFEQIKKEIHILRYGGKVVLALIYFTANTKAISGKSHLKKLME